MSSPTLYHYDKCGTCRKAQKFLEEQDLSVELRPIVDHPPSVDELRAIWQRAGVPLKRFFNTSGQSYRALPNREGLDAKSDDEKLALLAADGKLIRRPILDDGKRALVGFKEAEWQQWLQERTQG